MAQTPFGSVAGNRIADTSQPTGQIVIKSGWQAVPLEIPVITPEQNGLMDSITDLLKDFSSDNGLTFPAVEYYDTDGDGKGDHFIVGIKISI
jgi:hypothetical protein